jgi:hypothetical protein
VLCVWYPADISRFGTFLTRGSTVDQRLPKAAEQLQDGDVLKFGSNTRCATRQKDAVTELCSVSFYVVVFVCLLPPC